MKVAAVAETVSCDPRHRGCLPDAKSYAVFVVQCSCSADTELCEATLPSNDDLLSGFVMGGDVCSVAYDLLVEAIKDKLAAPKPRKRRRSRTRVSTGVVPNVEGQQKLPLKVAMTS